jgi:ABC-type branched-subunit amino acid transport system substrate-binding protein
MLMRRASARTQVASGRFVWLAWVILGLGCALPGGPSERSAAPQGPSDPILAPGPIAPAREAAAAALYDQAEAELAAGRPEEALRSSGTIVEEFPASTVSGRALLLRARAALAAGNADVADAAAERFIGLVAPDDPRVARLRVLQAEALRERPDEALERLARLVTGSSEDVAAARELARAAVLHASREGLDDAFYAGAGSGPIRPVLEARFAALAFLDRDAVRASAWSREALEHGAVGADSVLAVSVLGGSLPEGYVTARSLALGVVLPLEGAPALAGFSRLLLEGIEVAVATVAGPELEVALEVRDDAGDPERTAATVAELERSGVAGVVGFLEEVSLQLASEARAGDVPLLSPTARMGSTLRTGVYSLEGIDSVGIHELALHAGSRGYTRVAFIESTSPLSTAAAGLFERELEQLGIPVVGRYAYAEGATFFESQIRPARDALRADEIRALGLSPDDTLRVEMLEPVALFVPVPAEDVELIAPQIIHFGLDTLAIEVLGTNGWTDSETLRRVDTRHTDGVAATAPIGIGAAGPGYLRFKAAYEEHFQRSLVSAVPAVGYDVALLVLEAARLGGGANEGLRAALERLEDIEGATGVFSVVDGRVVRRTRAVLIERGNLTPIPIG